jgi:hypothetical protein
VGIERGEGEVFAASIHVIDEQAHLHAPIAV